jgi:polar amino acid transport system substrate-binding protein
MSLWRTTDGAVLALILLSCLAINACDKLPRDPKKTSERVQQQHSVRVGLTENPPWVIRTAGEPRGVEVELIRNLANSLGATPKWFWGGEQMHMEALEHFELDVVISGLNAKTPWSKRVGLTGPYFDEQLAVAVPSGTQAPESLRDLKVAVPEGDAIAAYLQKKGAVPLRTATVFETGGPAVAPVWALEPKGFTRTKFIVFEKKHVMAVPPGENGWLKELGSYLEKQKPNLPILLRREAQQ